MVTLRACARPAIFPTFPEGRRWTATGVLTSRRRQEAPRSTGRGDEGSLPLPRPPATCHAQPRVGRLSTKWFVSGLVATVSEVLTVGSSGGGRRQQFRFGQGNGGGLPHSD